MSEKQMRMRQALLALCVQAPEEVAKEITNVVMDAIGELEALNADKFTTIQAYCKAASNDKWQIKVLSDALKEIHAFPVHSEPVGGAYCMQDIASVALDKIAPIP